ncbi:MAG: sigma-70 family RNA polymerase sigma factor [Candidatus Margulisiibacteriota bacterium]
MGNQVEMVVLNSVKEGVTLNKEVLLTDNMGLIYSFARRYDGAYFQDIFQEACIGLLTAADRYESDRGTKFSTYATFWINQAVQKGYQVLKRNVRIPSTSMECIQKIKKVITKFMTEQHRVPTSEEISEVTGILEAKVDYYQQIDREVLSLDQLVYENDSIGDYIEDKTALGYQQNIDTQECNRLIGEALGSLSDKERRIVEMHYGFEDGQEKSLADIGRILGISRERVRQIKERAIAKLYSLHADALRSYL